MEIFETWEQGYLAALVVLVFLAFVKEWVSTELVAISALVACVLAGILNVTPGDELNALKVFSHPAPITVACMFILSAGLEKTGVIEAMGIWFEKIAGSSPLRSSWQKRPTIRRRRISLLNECMDGLGRCDSPLK